jgi:DNA-directed RNA polymerase specialized sigma subunit
VWHWRRKDDLSCTADQEAILKQWTRLIEGLAKREARSHRINEDDAISAAYTGAVYCIKNHDPSKGAQIQTLLWKAIPKVIRQLARRDIEERRAKLQFSQSLEFDDDEGGRKDERFGTTNGRPLRLASSRGLGPEEYRVLLLKSKGLKDADIAPIVGLSRERVRQIKEEAFTKLEYQ